ncbi:MAG: GNAT family N-acetyltransferase [Candidatus Competibacteraceae bacterium]
MPDMLVKLYNLPNVAHFLKVVSKKKIEIRHPKPWDKNTVIDWVENNFSEWWAHECEAAFRTFPPSCFIAVKKNKIVGFACYDCTAMNFFGPTGVAEEEQGNGIGKALLLAALNKMRSNGYGYAIIGAVGPAEFYKKIVGATIIEDSEPGIYTEELND